MPTNLAQTAHHVITGVVSGAIAAFIGVKVHQARTAGASFGVTTTQRA